MKKLIFAVLLLVLITLFTGRALATDAVYNRNRVLDVVGWHVCVVDDDIDTTAELVTELDTTYLQITTSYDTLEVLSSDANDTTQSVTVYGIDNNNNKTSETFNLNGDIAVGGSDYFQFVDYAEVSSECKGTITIRRATGDTFIVSIPAGQLNSQVAQHFNGEENSYITSWSAGVTSTDGAITYELRWYPDDSDSRCFLNGYTILDYIYVDATAASPYNIVRSFTQPIKCPPGGWIAVFATGAGDNCDGVVTIQGYDTWR